MLIALNQHRRRQRHRLAAMLVALALCWLLIAAHGALADQHMADGVAVCLALAESAALVLAAAMATSSAASRSLPRASWPQVAIAPQLSAGCEAPKPRSRAGPALLQVFRQ